MMAVKTANRLQYCRGVPDNKPANRQRLNRDVVSRLRACVSQMPLHRQNTMRIALHIHAHGVSCEEGNSPVLLISLGQATGMRCTSAAKGSWHNC